MLSYQHIYHAGNLADVQKHAILAWILAYLQRKDKPISYIETHSGRAVYDLTAAEAIKTGEAALGIQRPISPLGSTRITLMPSPCIRLHRNKVPIITQGRQKSPKSCYATKIRSI